MCPSMVLFFVVLVTYNIKYELNHGEVGVVDEI